jgi:hypothetical protein
MCLVQTVATEARALLAPLQVGISVAAGADALIHSVWGLASTRASDPSVALLQIDFKNAFNFLDRTTFIQEVVTHLPVLGPWVRWCYESPSHLTFDGHVIPSGRRVQQGDSLGPLLFCVSPPRGAEDPDGHPVGPFGSSWVLSRRWCANRSPLLTGAGPGDSTISRGCSPWPALESGQVQLFWPQEPSAETLVAYPAGLPAFGTVGTTVLGSPIGCENLFQTRCPLSFPAFHRP